MAKLSIVQFCQASCYFLPVRTKYEYLSLRQYRCGNLTSRTEPNVFVNTLFLTPFLCDFHLILRTKCHTHKISRQNHHFLTIFTFLGIRREVVPRIQSDSIFVVMQYWFFQRRPQICQHNHVFKQYVSYLYVVLDMNMQSNPTVAPPSRSAHESPRTEVPCYTVFPFTATRGLPPQTAVNEQWRPVEA